MHFASREQLHCIQGNVHIPTMHCFVLRRKKKGKKLLFFFFHCSEIKIKDVFWLTPAAEAQAFLQVSRLAFSFFPFSLLSNKATFHIKYIGCLIAAKCISHRVGPRQGLCSLCIIRRDIERYPLSLGSIHQHPPVHFLLQLSAFLTHCAPPPPTFSLVWLFISCLLNKSQLKMLYHF